jgi:hypothetical protein
MLEGLSILISVFSDSSFLCVTMIRSAKSLAVTCVGCWSDMGFGFRLISAIKLQSVRGLNVSPLIDCSLEGV